MADDLISKLRTCSAEERRAAAIELGQTRTSEAVEELIRIAEGGEFKPKQMDRKHWFSLSDSSLSKEKWEYGAEAQIAAIEALGETKSKTALNFLKQLADYRQDVDIDPKVISTYSPDCMPVYRPFAKINVTFPAARGELREKLSLHEEYFICDVLDYEEEERNAREELPKKYYSNPFYCKIRESIGKLERAIPSDTEPKE